MGVYTRLGVTYCIVCGTPCGRSPSVMSLCHAVWRGVDERCVCVSPCHWGVESMLAYMRRVAGKAVEWRACFVLKQTRSLEAYHNGIKTFGP